MLVILIQQWFFFIEALSPLKMYSKFGSFNNLFKSQVHLFPSGMFLAVSGLILLCNSMWVFGGLKVPVLSRSKAGALECSALWPLHELKQALTPLSCTAVICAHRQ